MYIKNTLKVICPCFIGSPFDSEQLAQVSNKYFHYRVPDHAKSCVNRV